MGGCASTDAETRKRRDRSKGLDNMMRKEIRALNEEVKILLLGPGESGKSTVFKQMKIITNQGGGFTQDELRQYRFIVFGNCITQMKVLIAAAEKLDISLDSDSNREAAARVMKLPPGGGCWNSNVGDDVKQLWTDKGIQKTYDHRDAEFQLNDSASYFFENVDRFIEESFIPTQQDVLRARVRSTGIEEVEFEFQEMCFRMLDVGGQRSERRKWIHCFDCVTAVLFCAAISEYDQVLREDESANRMQESLLLFDEVINSPWFEGTAFILFLNKIDLFAEKIQRVPLTTCFPEYSGGQNVEDGHAFINEQFQQKKRQSDATIYTHFTCAINTDNIATVFQAVKVSLMKDVMDTIAI